MKYNLDNLKRMESWNVSSPESEGFHKVISPDIQECKASRISRLNLSKGNTYKLESKDLEMCVSMISGKAYIKSNVFDNKMKKLDCFYIPGGCTVDIKAEDDCIFYIGAAICAGIGSEIFLNFDKDIPLGPKHEIHGSGVAQREVFLMLDEATPASRIMCGYTIGGDGEWTSWPPHQHEKTLEETYCYFDMPAPKFGFQMTYLKEGQVEDIFAHKVRSGNMVIFPCGYHPTVASPGTRNTYLWVLIAFEPHMRKFGVMEFDKNYCNTIK